MKPPRRLRRGDVAGFAGGVLLYIVALNYIQHGPDGVKGWLRAKFLNQPDTTIEAPGPLRAPERDDGAGSGTSVTTAEALTDGAEVTVNFARPARARI